MVTEQDVMNSLKQVVDPEIRVSIVDLGMVQNVNINGNAVDVTIALTVPSCPLSSTIESDVKNALTSLPGVENANVKLASMTKEEREEVFRKLGRKFGMARMGKEGSRHVIAITSGKGGVGKSAVTALFAAELKRQGLNVGILDSDITGPSIAKMFGVTRLGVSEKGVTPAVSKQGVEIMSMHLLLKKPDDPVIWRGPILHNVVTQMYKDVSWGELDYLLIDVPPGTSDIPLTLYQTFP
ncbi:MAG: P-loop NTPase, partial [Candidatus Bathyarchaeia archaeon]